MVIIVNINLLGLLGILLERRRKKLVSVGSVVSSYVADRSHNLVTTKHKEQ